MKDPHKAATSSCGHRSGHCYVLGVGTSFRGCVGMCRLLLQENERQGASKT